jgi:hypothetical protein
MRKADPINEVRAYIEAAPALRVRFERERHPLLGRRAPSRQGGWQGAFAHIKAVDEKAQIKVVACPRRT